MTEKRFEDYRWHDNSLYSISFVVGDAERGDWTSNLVLDIDYLLEWVPTAEGMRFRVAPATLSFHGVTDPRIAIDWGSSAFQVSHGPPSIDRIERERVRDQKVFLDRPYYAWRIVLNAPGGGELTFGAVGFSQTLRKEPVLSARQKLPRDERDG